MHKTMQKSFRENMIVLSLILAIIFASVNVILYVLNQSYLEQKIEEENQAFLQLTTHLMNENDVVIALEYVEHYTHIHDVEIEVTNEQDIMLFSSNISYRYTREYQIDTLKGRFTIYMDNTESATVASVQRYFVFTNVTLFSLYVLAVVLLYYMSRKNASLLNRDVQELISLIKDHKETHQDIYYEELETIYSEMSSAFQQIDLLQEQKDINVKSLAHDIKTPLTILYGFLHQSSTKTPTSSQVQDAMDAAQSINQFVDSLLDETYDQQLHTVELTSLIKTTVDRLQGVMSTKDISVVMELESVTVKWNEQDASRVLENVLSNAYQYSKPSSVIHIVLSKSDPIDLKLSSEPKNPMKDPHRLFEKGYTSTNQPNKGLGLYICRLLLSAVNGTINATQDKNSFTIHISI
jgi:signal transduction histidine kinase